MAQLNSGQYKIRQTNGKKHLLRIAQGEEEKYAKLIRKLNKKIYRTNWLGVQFASSVRQEKEALELDEQFEAEKPVFEASLTKAIVLLVRKANCAFVDLTE